MTLETVALALFEAIKESALVLFTGAASIVVLILRKKAKIADSSSTMIIPTEESPTSTMPKKVIAQAKRCETCSEHDTMKTDSAVQSEVLSIMREERIEMQKTISKIFDQMNTMNTFMVRVAEDVAFLRGRDSRST